MVFRTTPRVGQVRLQAPLSRLRSCCRMSDVLPVIVGGTLVFAFCVAVGTFSNRTFGHPTFFRCHSCSKDSCDIKNESMSSDGTIDAGTSNIRCRPNSTTDTRDDCRGNPPARRVDCRYLGGDSGNASTVEKRQARREGHRGTTCFFFADAPVGVVEHIGSFLFPAELVDVSLVSSAFLLVMSESPLVWREHCSRNFGTSSEKWAEVLGEAWREDVLSKCARPEDCEAIATRGACSVGEVTGGNLPASVPLGVRGRAGIGKSIASGGWDACKREEEHGNDTLSNDHRKDVRCSLGSLGERTPSSRHDSHDDRPSSGDCSRRQRARLSVLMTSSPSSSWKQAFFAAHRTRPRQILEEARVAYSAASPPHVSLSRCVILVGGRVHDLTGFLSDHPGGALVLEEHASTDATHEFERFLHSREARRIAQDFVVWDGVKVMGRPGTLLKYYYNRR